jgi:hypothetical protein
MRSKNGRLIQTKLEQHEDFHPSLLLHDKEELVVKLHQENKTIRQIAEIVHMSFGDIGAIIRRNLGEINFFTKVQVYLNNKRVLI